MRFATCPSHRNGFSIDTGRPTQETSRTSFQSAWGHFLSETVAPDISRLSTRSLSWVRTSATWWCMSTRTWKPTRLCLWSMKEAQNLQLYPCEIFGGTVSQYTGLSACPSVCPFQLALSSRIVIKQRRQLSYDVARLHLTAPMDFWQNSTPF